MIGVTSNTNYCHSYYWSRNDTECYAMFCNGHLYDSDGTGKPYANNKGTFEFR